MKNLFQTVSAGEEWGKFLNKIDKVSPGIINTTDGKVVKPGEIPVDAENIHDEKLWEVGQQKKLLEGLRGEVEKTGLKKVKDVVVQQGDTLAQIAFAVDQTATTEYMTEKGITDKKKVDHAQKALNITWKTKVEFYAKGGKKEAEYTLQEFMKLKEAHLIYPGDIVSFFNTKETGRDKTVIRVNNVETKPRTKGEKVPAASEPAVPAAPEPEVDDVKTPEKDYETPNIYLEDYDANGEEEYVTDDIKEARDAIGMEEDLFRLLYVENVDNGINGVEGSGFYKAIEKAIDGGLLEGGVLGWTLGSLTGGDLSKSLENAGFSEKQTEVVQKFFKKRAAEKGEAYKKLYESLAEDSRHVQDKRLLKRDLLLLLFGLPITNIKTPFIKQLVALPDVDSVVAELTQGKTPSYSDVQKRVFESLETVEKEMQSTIKNLEKGDKVEGKQLELMQKYSLALEGLLADMGIRIDERGKVIVEKGHVMRNSSYNIFEKGILLGLLGSNSGDNRRAIRALDTIESKDSSNKDKVDAMDALYSAMEKELADDFNLEVRYDAEKKQWGAEYKSKIYLGRESVGSKNRSVGGNGRRLYARRFAGGEYQIQNEEGYPVRNPDQKFVKRLEEFKEGRLDEKASGRVSALLELYRMKEILKGYLEYDSVFTEYQGMAKNAEIGDFSPVTVESRDVLPTHASAHEHWRLPIVMPWAAIGAIGGGGGNGGPPTGITPKGAPTGIVPPA